MYRVTRLSKVKYRVTLVIEYLSWVDLDLESCPGWWAAAVVTYCPSRMVEHHKSKSTQPRYANTSVALHAPSSYVCRRQRAARDNHEDEPHQVVDTETHVSGRSAMIAPSSSSSSSPSPSHHGSLEIEAPRRRKTVLKVAMRTINVAAA